jgi:hypothetical protein
MTAVVTIDLVSWARLSSYSAAETLRLGITDVRREEVFDA